MKITVILFVFFLLLGMLQVIPVSGQTQALSTRSKKAERYFFDASDAYNARDYARAIKDLIKAVQEDPSFVEAYILKGDIYSDAKRIQDAISSYKQAIAANPEFSPTIYYIVANNELMIGRYQDAKTDYEKFISYPNIAPEKKDRSVVNIGNCDFGLNAMAHPVPFQPVNLGDNVNSPLDEYVNAITSDEQRLYFTRKLPRDAETIDQSNEFEEDFFYCDKQDSVWKMALNLGPPINTHGNEGALCISPDGKMIFFAADRKGKRLTSSHLVI